MKRPPLKQQHKYRRIEWAEKYMKTDFSSVMFTDECRPTFDGPDGWAKEWISFNDSSRVRARRQHIGQGVMFWAAIVGDSIIGPFRIEDGIKIYSKGHFAFLNKHFLPRWKKQPLKLRRTLMCMYNNALSHVLRYTTALLMKLEIKTS